VYYVGQTVGYKGVYAKVVGLGACPWGVLPRLSLQISVAATSALNESPVVDVMATEVSLFLTANQVALAAASSYTTTTNIHPIITLEGEVGEEGGVLAGTSLQQQQQQQQDLSGALQNPATSLHTPYMTSAADTLSALKSLQTRLGLPSLSTATSQHLEELISLRASEKTLAGEVNKLRKESAALKGALESAKLAWTCAICFSAEVNTLLTPCGHTMCASCLSALPNPPTCPFERTPIASSIRIFRPS